MRKIKLTQGKYALVDDEDFEYLNQWNWYAGENRSGFFAARGEFNGKNMNKILMHRVIMNCEKGKVVDHIDHNTLNNQKSNLRNCTTAENIKRLVKLANKKLN